MNARTSRMIERHARANGLSFYEAASALAKRKRRSKRQAPAKTEAQINDERFQAMRQRRPDLYN